MKWLVALALVVSIGGQALATTDCMTLPEARAKYPNDHLWKTRGCWGLGAPRKVGRALETRKPHATIPTPVPAPEIRAEVVVDANGNEASKPSFGGGAPFVMFAMADDGKKGDRLPLFDEAEQQPVPVPLPPVKPIKPVSSLATALVTLAGAMFAVAIAFIVSRKPWRMKPNANSSLVARFNHKLAARRQRKIVGSDGAGNQQPHFHPWDVRQRDRGTDFGGYASDPHPFASGRNNAGAIGAWAKSRGLRPEKIDTGQHGGVEQFGKRVAHGAR